MLLDTSADIAPVINILSAEVFLKRLMYEGVGIGALFVQQSRAFLNKIYKPFCLFLPIVLFFLFFPFDIFAQLVNQFIPVNQGTPLLIPPTPLGMNPVSQTFHQPSQIVQP